jgi:hypothetical protein
MNHLGKKVHIFYLLLPTMIFGCVSLSMHESVTLSSVESELNSKSDKYEVSLRVEEHSYHIKMKFLYELVEDRNTPRTIISYWNEAGDAICKGDFEGRWHKDMVQYITRDGVCEKEIDGIVTEYLCGGSQNTIESVSGNIRCS